MTHDDLLKIIRHPDNDQEEIPFRADCEEIKRIVEERYGVRITLRECHDLWERYSGAQDAQWLSVFSCTSGEICEAASKWACSFFKLP